MNLAEYRSQLAELDKAKPKPPKRRFSTTGFPTAWEARYQEQLAAWYAEKLLLAFKMLSSKGSIHFCGDRPGHKTLKSVVEFAKQFQRGAKP